MCIFAFLDVHKPPPVFSPNPPQNLLPRSDGEKDTAAKFHGGPLQARLTRVSGDFEDSLGYGRSSVRYKRWMSTSSHWNSPERKKWDVGWWRGEGEPFGDNVHHPATLRWMSIIYCCAARVFHHTMGTATIDTANNGVHDGNQLLDRGCRSLTKLEDVWYHRREIGERGLAKSVDITSFAKDIRCAN